MRGLTDIERMNLVAEIKAAAKARVRKDGTLEMDLHDFSFDCPDCGQTVRVYEFEGEVGKDGLVPVQCDDVTWRRNGCGFKGFARLGA